MKKPIEELLGSQIANIRKRRNLTQAQLAESVNVATETISRIERGISIPSVKTLEKISHALQTPLTDFFAFEPAPPARADDRENALAKVMMLLQNKKRADIQLSHQVLKALFEQLKHHYRPIRIESKPLT